MNSNTASLLPKQFGPLQGVRILSTGSLIAQPFAAAIAAEMGAEVIQIEPPKIGGVVRCRMEAVGVRYGGRQWSVHHRRLGSNPPQ